MVSGWTEDITVGKKGEIAGYQLFSPFAIIFSKTILFRVAKSQDYTEKD